jgi:predicted Zn-dependent protease with MMP-like domain
MGPDEFDKLVEDAWDALPATFRSQLRNVEVVVEEWPDAETLKMAHVHHPAGLLGFYHGVPLPARGQGYSLVTPDKISLYRQPILLQCRTMQEVPAAIAHVLQHEIAHHFGISDARLRELGAY